MGGRHAWIEQKRKKKERKLMGTDSSVMIGRGREVWRGRKGIGAISGDGQRLD